MNPLHQRLLSALLKQVSRERRGENIDVSLLQKIIKSFVTLGIDGTDFQKTSLALYVDLFEKQFLEETGKLYVEESNTYIASNPLTEYLKKAEGWLDEEDFRVKSYLHSSTQKPLIALTEMVLLSKQASIIQDQFKPLLEREKLDDLKRMFALLSRVPDTLGPLRETFENHVKEEGHLATRKIAESLCISTEPGEARERSASTISIEERKIELDPKVYSDALLQVYSKFNVICKNTFNSDGGFATSLDKACREFVNRNALCIEGSSKSSELMARYCDSLLRKTNKMNEDSEMEILLKGVVQFFGLLQ